jgi:predicted TIM-barrel fold metal-dependent hydrolase
MAQDLIVQHETFERMVEAYVAAVEGARAAGYVGLKSIAAYRTGLAISPPDRGAPASAFAAVKARARRDGAVRLADKPLNDHLVLLALAVAERQQLPVQFHTGFGDADLDLLWANPLHMRPLFENGRYRHVPFVLLHAGYPYVRELGYLATLYGNVFVDVGLAIPFVTVDIPTLWSQLLALTATSKILFSTDAYSIPDIYWLATRWGRWGLARALEAAMSCGALTEAEALESARAILGDNAARLYGVEL